MQSELLPPASSGDHPSGEAGENEPARAPSSFASVFSLFRNSHAIPLLLYTAIVLALIAPTFRMYGWMGDEKYFPHLRVKAMSELWAVQGPFHVPWLPDACYGYGWPFFTFYAPFGYYVGCLAHLIGFTYGAGVKISFYLSLYFSGLFLYFLIQTVGGRENWPRVKGWGLAAAAIYLLAPYHLFDVFGRSSLAESWAWAFLPATVLGVEICRTRPRAGLVFTTFAVAALLLSHNISALYAALFVGLYVVLTPGSVRWRFVVLLAALLGLTMAAYYWYPAVVLKRLVLASDTRVMHATPDDLRQSSLFWREYFFEPQVPGRAPGFVLLAGVFLVMAALFRPGWGRGQRYNLAILLSFLGVLAVGMSPQMPWAKVPEIFTYIQYPWRMLLFFSFFSVFSLARASPIIGRWIHPGIVIGFALLAGVATIIHRGIEPSAPEMSDARLVDWENAEANRNAPVGSVAQEYLPTWVKYPYVLAAFNQLNPAPADRLTAMEGKIRVGEYDHKGTAYAYRYLAETESVARLHLFDFPGWELTINGKPAPDRLSRDPDGLLQVKLPAGRNEMKVAYEISPTGRAALAVSHGAWILWGALTVGFGYLRFVRRRSLRGSYA